MVNLSQIQHVSLQYNLIPVSSICMFYCLLGFTPQRLKVCRTLGQLITMFEKGKDQRKEEKIFLSSFKPAAVRFMLQSTIRMFSPTYHNFMCKRMNFCGMKFCGLRKNSEINNLCGTNVTQSREIIPNCTSGKIKPTPPPHHRTISLQPEL